MIIRAIVRQQNCVIMDRLYRDSGKSPEAILKDVEGYLVRELINQAGECIIRIIVE